MVKLTLECKKPIADDSPDHIQPYGTKNNSRNIRFNRKLDKLYKKPISILDLGCAGGAFVKDCIDEGDMAIGLEGSDYSKKNKKAEWTTIPDSLFTCDITKNFNVYEGKKRFRFNVITAWEVMEHIKEEDLDALIKNIVNHMADDCLVIMSIANFSDIQNGIELHQTQKPKDWWIDKFSRYGLVYRPEYLAYFNTQYIRGKYEFENNFHLILSKRDSVTPIPPRLSIIDKVIDRWKGSVIYNEIAYRIPS